MFFLNFFRYLATALAAQDSAKALAGGFALGFWAGLVPKSSLLAHLLLIVISMTRVNLAVGYLSALIFSALSVGIDPIAHAVGNVLLTKLDVLKPLWVYLYNLPIVPWTQFNNTIVLGFFLIGGALSYPLYRRSIPLFEQYGHTFGATLQKWRVSKILLGASWWQRLKGP